MRLLYLIISLQLIAFAGNSQIQTIWTEDFNNGCTSNCLANTYTGTNGPWTVADVTAPGNVANEWFISCAENGELIGSCGAACGSNATLHVASVPCNLCLVCPNGDCGAAYNAGPTFGGQNPTSDKRSQSPLINTTGYSNIILSFKYIERGRNTTDDAMVEYSTNAGLTWTLLFNTAKTVNCGSGQGTWTSYSDTLPASCNNITNLMLGFHWKNNADGLGTDPSFAVDDVTLAVDVTGIETNSCATTISINYHSNQNIIKINSTNTFERAIFTLISANGKVIEQADFNANTSFINYSFNTSLLSSGVYIAKVVTDKNIVTQKIVIN